MVVFEAELADYPGIGATLALADGDTLVSLHELLCGAFGWDDPHGYSFWLDGTFRGDPAAEYTAPDASKEGRKTADVALDRLGLEPGQQIAYVVDFDDEWRVELTVAPPVVEGPVPRVVERRGSPPPQYQDFDDDEIGGSE